MSIINNSVTSTHYGVLQSHTKYSVREFSLFSFIILVQYSLFFFNNRALYFIDANAFCNRNCNIYVMCPTYINIITRETLTRFWCRTNRFRRWRNQFLGTFICRNRCPCADATDLNLNLGKVMIAFLCEFNNKIQKELIVHLGKETKMFVSVCRA